MKDKLLNILKGAGAAALSSHPLGALAVQVIGAATGKPLTGDETGDQVLAEINALPAEQRGKLLEAEIQKEIALDDNRTERYKAMCAADGQQTRARVVVIAMYALIALTVLCIGIMGWVYIESGDADIAFSAEMVAAFVVLLGPFAYVVRAYFGDLKSETQSRHKVIDDKAPALASGLAGVVQAIRGGR